MGFQWARTERDPSILDPVANAAAAMKYFAERDEHERRRLEQVERLQDFYAGAWGELLRMAEAQIAEHDRRRRPWWARALAWGIAAYYLVRR